MRPALAAATVFALAACTAGSDRFRPLAVGAPVPEYTVHTLGGDTARVATGEPLTLLNVWATWCAPCQQEFPDLERIHRDFGGRGLRVIGVSVDDGDDTVVARFAREHGATFIIGHDDAGRVQRLFQTIGVPETFLIAPNGTLLWRHLGALPPGATDLRAVIARALARDHRAD